MNFPERYDSKAIEKKWQDWWLNNAVYNWNPDEPRERNFSIDTPPPTVSGMLHMGHIFSYTQTDFIARFQRMIGRNVFYPIGFDDNGLPTERLVEKIKDVRAAQMPRQAFIDLCQDVVQEAEEEFRILFRSIALSVDWNQEYQTISAESRKISQLSFIDLYNKGLVNKQYAPTFWDPADRTAIAQAEIEDKEKQGVMYEVAFTTNSGARAVIATTRPEMLSACVAVLYHPDDARYQHLKHQHAITPIFGERVPFIEDYDVAMDKGTGLVMCCTFGDIQDVEWWRRHGLPLKSCLHTDGFMHNSGVYNGLKTKEARQKIVDDLSANGAILSQTSVTQMVKCAERSGAPLELIATSQWFISVMDYKEQLLAKAAQCKWHPQYMQVRLENWIKGLKQDWCISRQRYFGVPFPAWYSKRPGEEGKILIAAPSQLPVDPLTDLPAGYSRDEVEPDMDVMDTWATSSVTPQLNSKALNNILGINFSRHSKLYPFDLRPQAHEIIRTWAFSTIVKAMHHDNSIPWQHLAISGWCLAADKTKMSKSKGNIVTPTELIIEKGADAIRYWAANSKLGVDIAYSDELFKIGNKIINKLWNVAKFISLHTDKLTKRYSSPADAINATAITHKLDLWLISRLHEVVSATTESFTHFDYSEGRMVVEDFFWNDLCDNYLEMIKIRIYDADGRDPQGQQSAIITIYHALDAVLRLLAPILPHITEEIWHLMGMAHGSSTAVSSIHGRGNWPEASAYPYQDGLLAQGEAAIQLLSLIRKFKSQHNLSLKAELAKVEYYSPTSLDSAIIADLQAAANSNDFIPGAAMLIGDGVLASEDGKYTVQVSL
ncbi:MAG: valine--tRNA ligase [Proteobacteria bacterium]|nr:valine--tRNA ligase [Pseudomonadota bacterium]